MSTMQDDREDPRISPSLDWPATFERTDPDDREPYPGDLSPTRKESFQSIVEELERWGATDVRIHTASQHYVDRPNIPHQYDKPGDVGVVARFRRAEGPADQGHALACDRWETQRENARAIALYARRMRLAERCGVATADSTFATARLPPAGEETDAIAADPVENAERPAHEVLGVDPDAPDAVVKGAFRELVKGAHGDHGGDGDVQRLKEARDEMLHDN